MINKITKTVTLSGFNEISPQVREDLKGIFPIKAEIKGRDYEGIPTVELLGETYPITMFIFEKEARRLNIKDAKSKLERINRNIGEAKALLSHYDESSNDFTYTKDVKQGIAEIKQHIQRQRQAINKLQSAILLHKMKTTIEEGLRADNHFSTRWTITDEKPKF